MNIERLEEKLLRMVRLDYDIQIYYHNTRAITISFNHLNSLYNALATINIEGQIVIDWQYHNKSKVVIPVVNAILNEIKYAIGNNHRIEIITMLFEKYHNKALQVYHAKYGVI